MKLIYISTVPTKLNMKRFFVFILTWLYSMSSQAQTIIQFGNRKVIATTVDSSTFSIYGKWQIVHRDYVAETPHSYDLLPLELLSPNIFAERKNQGETCYGNIVEFKNSLFYPYAPYMPRLLLNPSYSKNYEFVGVGKSELNNLYVKKFQDKKYLTLQVYCGDSLNDEFSIIVLNENIIVTLNNNAYTYMERYSGNNDWKYDQDKYASQELVGLAHFDIFVPQQYINQGYKLAIIFQTKKNDFENQYVSVLRNNTCLYKEEEVISSKEEVREIISLKQLPSNIIRIHGSTKSQLGRWRVKWKFVSN